VDGGGDGKTTTRWLGEGNSLRELPDRVCDPHSLGLFYTRITRYLGFGSTGDEYKVMGLAAYGKPEYYNEMKDMIIYKNGSFRLNMKYFDYQYRYGLSKKFLSTFGPPRSKDEDISEHYQNIAASAQRVFEETVLKLALGAKKQTGVKNLAICGGSALNCKANGELLLTGEFDNIYVLPSAGDAGTSIGAAQYHYHQVMGGPKSFVLRTDDWGPGYDENDILLNLKRSGVKYEKLNDPAIKAAELLAEGNIVGWFQGRMEFGPRALGNRSILADPRSADVKDRVNATIKFREQFRPFAPSCLREHVAEYFEADVDSPFMTFTVGCHKEKQAVVPAIVHVDGTSRLQSVSKEDQPLYHALISRFYELTGVPIVLNTSFNLAGEPIVCSPYDALRTFITCGIDVLIMGDFMVTKE
jgi:carbamoyltransferase